MDFSQMLKQQASLTSNDSNENSFVQPKRPALRIGQNNSNVLVRILPLGDKYFATSFRVAFLKLNKKDGTVINQMVRFPVRDTVDLTSAEYDEQLAQRDPLFGAVKKALEIERENKGALDISTNPRFDFAVRERHMVAVVPVNMNTRAMTTTPEGNPDIRLLELSNPAYNGILNAIMTGGYTLPGGKPFPDELSFISAGETYPVAITLNDKSYNITVRPDILLPPMPNNYLQRTDDNQDYVFFDDPYRFSRSSFEELNGSEENSYYNYILNQVQDKLARYNKNNQIDVSGVDDVLGNAMGMPSQAPANPYVNQGSQNPYNNPSTNPYNQQSAGNTYPTPAQSASPQARQAVNNTNSMTTAPINNSVTPQPSPQVQPSTTTTTTTSAGNVGGSTPINGNDSFNPATGNFDNPTPNSTEAPTQAQPQAQNQPNNQAPADNYGMTASGDLSDDDINNLINQATEQL